MLGSMAAGRYGAVAVAESFMSWSAGSRRREKKERGTKRDWGWCGFLKPQSVHPVTFLLQQGHTSQSFPNSSTNWGPSIQTHEPMGAILTQATITGMTVFLSWFLPLLSHLSLLLPPPFLKTESHATALDGLDLPSYPDQPSLEITAILCLCF